MPVCLRLPVLKVDRSQAGLLLNQWGLIVGWACDTANVYDSVFHPIIEQFRDEMIILADTHFHLSAFCLSADRQAQAGSQEGDPDNLKICRRGEWNVRMLVETVFSMLTTVSHFKKLAHLPIGKTGRVWEYFEAHLGFAMAAFNILVQWHGLQPNRDGFIPLSIAEFSL